jgi:hypothetical protein
VDPLQDLRGPERLFPKPGKKRPQTLLVKSE